MSAITTPGTVGVPWLVTGSVIPWDIGQTMNACNCEKRLNVSLIVFLYGLCIEYVQHWYRADRISIHTKGLDVKREEFLILYEVINFKTIWGATRSTSYDKARHSWNRLLHTRLKTETFIALNPYNITKAEAALNGSEITMQRYQNNCSRNRHTSWYWNHVNTPR